jgi:3-hydroxybutyryl-CoA dehydrogenase
MTAETHPQATQNITVLGAGTMGTGIAQVAAGNGHHVVLLDKFTETLKQAEQKLTALFDRLVERGKYSRTEADGILERIEFAEKSTAEHYSNFVIEAVIEDREVKEQEFRKMQVIVDDDCIIATNTSSLSIAGLAACLKQPERFIGVHFFNPAPLMPLVEIVPAMTTSPETTERARALVDSWGKTTVLTKDTPGFIVNRIARPFYAEPLKMLEEGLADAATIDWAMKSLGGFRMGPFELMDLIGNDVNYAVTETVWRQFYFDPRFRPSILQKRMVEAGMLGRKSGRGFYEYGDDVPKPEPREDDDLGREILMRTLVLLINEAVDALFMGIASAQDIELAMTKGVNYPKGLLAWGDEIGPAKVLARLEELHAEFGDDRYRPNPLLRRAVREGRSLLS